MNYLTFIPARGGSKRLPQKNIRYFDGWPLIYYSLRIAQLAGLANIVVSTDDSKIAEVAENNNIEVILRPLELSNDTAKTIDALKHTLIHLQNKNRFFDAVITLQPTNPLRTVDVLKQAIARFEVSQKDSLITISKNDKKLGYLKNKSFAPSSYSFGERSQDITPLYFENGLIYISSSKLILEKNLITSDDNFAMLTDTPYFNVDIDTEEDFIVAESIYKTYKYLFNF